MTEEVAALTIRLEATQRRFEQDMQKARNSLRRAVSDMDRSAQRLNRRLESTGEGFASRIPGRAIAATAAIAAVGKAVSEVVRNGDQMRKLEARFNALAGSAEAGRKSLDSVLAIAGETGASIDGVAGAVTRFTIASKEIGGTADEVERLTATVLRLGTLGGSTTQELAAGAQQLGQALASGRLQGDELRSIMENLPLVARAIAEGLGVATGELKAMGKAGELTSRRVFDAILSKSEEVERQFGEMPVTLERATGQMAVAWAELTAEIDRSVGASETLIGLIQRATALMKALDNPAKPVGNALVTRLQAINAQKEEEIAALLAQGAGEDDARVRLARAAITRNRGLMGAARTQVAIEAPSPTDAGAVVALPGSPLPTARPGTGANPIDLSSEDAESGFGVFKPSKGSGSRGSGRSADALKRETESIYERIRALQIERQAMGLSGRALVQFQAAQEAARVKRELLTAAERDSKDVSEETRQAIAALAEEYRQAAEAVGLEELAVEEATEALERHEKAAEDAADAISEFGRNISSAIARADSFADALRSIALALADMAIQGIGGQGPLATILGGVGRGITDILGLTGGFAISGAAGATAPSFLAQPAPTLSFASGGLANAGAAAIVGERGPEPVIFGQDARIMSNRDFMEALGGGRDQPAPPGGLSVGPFHIDARGAQMGVAEQIEARLGRFVNHELGAAVRALGPRGQL